MRIKSKFGRAVALATAFASVASVGLITSSASADLGTLNTITPSTGTAAATFQLNVVSPSNACQGDTGTGGYRWSQYITAGSVNPGTLTVVAGAFVAPGAAFVQPLYDTFGNPQFGKNTASVTGQLAGVQTLNFQTNTVPGNGSYNIGFVCTLLGAVTRHWVTPITVTGFVSSTSFNWSFGAAPSAPAATAVGGDNVITGTITALTATPAVTGYRVTATRTSGTADASSPRILNTAAAGAYSLPAVNGAVYSVAITATNSIGFGAATTVAPVNVNFAPVSPAPVVNAPNGPSPILFGVTASTGTPPAGVTLVNNVATFTPVGAAAAIAPITFLPGGLPVSITGVAGASYNYTVVGNYSDGRQSLVASGVLSFSSAQLVVQDIQVVRPVGALVLTQQCGVFGSAAAAPDSTFGLQPALPAQPGGADPALVAGVLEAPTLATGLAPLNDSAPSNPNAGLGAPDALFPQYPYPVDAAGNSIATYATNCGIDLGTGQLITSGPRAGQYFRVSGRMAQMTVVNTRDLDSGWTLNGRMGQFTSTTDPVNDFFSGNLMGWNPEVTWDSNPNLDGYNMTVLAGGVRQPVATASTAGLGDPSNSNNTTLASSLAQAAPGFSLGQAVMDARLRLLVPVTADAGIYRGVLTFTTV